ncbi:Putative L-PSP endoribonuclease family protein [Aspergillus calidoustus]|uniref:Putative L-PSP endoribonuclease family protein n=1 Tax=Aspergillus calidoustus TaxID=454130 RepID=A0A0U5CFV8_ASPCI|nr:Putative L-PSP endoribonuclease family protein [Aspergillus calidoustus]
MSHIQYYAYKDIGDEKHVKFRFSQAVRLGDRIECAGQGGWEPKTGEFEKEIKAQIDLAFANVKRNLKGAGGKGWSQVFRVNSYHVPITNEALDAMVRSFKKYMPDHEPIWTCVGVTRLGEDDMRVETEVVPHDPEGAKAAGLI